MTGVKRMIICVRLYQPAPPPSAPQTADYVSDTLLTMPPIAMNCMIVSYTPYPSYTWYWFSGPSPPATVELTVTQAAASGGVDVWTSPVAPGPALATPSMLANCTA